jgi:hypothetical protein
MGSIPIARSTFNCLYAAESLKIPLEMVGFGRQMDAAASIGRCLSSIT